MIMVELLRFKPELEPILVRIFQELAIYEKTGDFKESNLDKWQREHNQAERQNKC
mgnify:CR=1 FL=1